MRIVVIGDESVVQGFALVGVEGEVVHTADEVRAALARWMAASDVGLVLITSDVASLVRAEVDDLKLHSLEPLVVEIPGSGETQPRTGVRALVEQTLGIRLGGD